MFPDEADALVVKQLMVPGAKANDSECSGDYVEIADAVGDLVLIHDVGAVSGSVQGAFYTADDSAGSNATTVLFNDGTSFANVTQANQIEKKVVDARMNQGYIRYVGTVTSGPISMGVSVAYRPKWTT